jgi:predicted TIM-barrel fold metal-dependent hydrolase
MGDVASIRAELDHPIIDADGHVVEALPVVVDYIRRVAGDAAGDRFLPSSVTFSTDDVPTQGSVMAPWWTVPTNARDRATSFLPSLLHERMDEVGIDFGVLYSSVGLIAFSHGDDATRRGACRGLNTYLADLLDGLGDRLTSAAVIPTHTPDEAIAELEHAVHDLGFKAVMLNDIVSRGGWYDVLALDSAHDYDPVWQACIDLGVAVTVHSPSWGVGLRQSSSRYMYNHIGNFAASADAFAKALFFGGVTNRFPDLHVAFLECGVSWAVQLVGDLVDRWQKRGPGRIDRLDPRHLDPVEWNELLDRHGRGLFDDPTVRATMAAQSGLPPANTDDFRATGVTSPADIVRQFDGLFFGCEADDATIPWAFGQPTLQPILGSDIGHWDVTDATEVVPEAWELVEDGKLTREQFRAFACDNAIRLHGGMNPAFFDGTRVEAYARERLASGTRPGN